MIDARTMPRLFVRHDGAALARMLGPSGMGDAGCDGVILPMPPTGPPFAVVVDGNPLAEGWLLDIDLPSERIVLRSGTLSAEPFGDDPRTWMRPGHEAFAAFCDAAAPTLRHRGKRIAFRPHARHVLNDVQGCLNFLRAREGQPFEIALAPADLLTEGMLPNADEHLTRILETLGSRASMILLGDVRPTADGLVETPLGDGVLPADTYRRLLRDCVPAETPLVLLPTGIDRQRAWLAADRPIARA